MQSKAQSKVLHFVRDVRIYAPSERVSAAASGGQFSRRSTRDSTRGLQSHYWIGISQMQIADATSLLRAHETRHFLQSLYFPPQSPY